MALRISGHFGATRELVPVTTFENKFQENVEPPLSSLYFPAFRSFWLCISVYTNPELTTQHKRGQAG